MTMTANTAAVFPAPRRGWRMGLTGGMGCGKSAAGKYLEAQHGWLRIDSDQLVRETLARSEIVAQIQALFGSSVGTADSAGIDRKALAAIVFADSSALHQLEEILHPVVRRQWTTAMTAAGDQPAVVEIPLLHEKRLAKSFDFTVCVEAVSSVQVRRLAERGLNSVQISARLQQQLPLQQKVDRSDVIISNSGTLGFLYAQIDVLIGSLSHQ